MQAKTMRFTYAWTFKSIHRKNLQGIQIGNKSVMENIENQKENLNGKLSYM